MVHNSALYRAPFWLKGKRPPLQNRAILVQLGGSETEGAEFECTALEGVEFECDEFGHVKSGAKNVFHFFIIAHGLI